jgi:hypothetical protein
MRRYAEREWAVSIRFSYDFDKVVAAVTFFGSEREFGGWAILRGLLDLLNSEEFGVRHDHPFDLEQ